MDLGGAQCRVLVAQGQGIRRADGRRLRWLHSTTTLTLSLPLLHPRARAEKNPPQVAKKFVKQYYHVMEEAADKLHLFYKDDSTLSFRLAEAEEPVVLHGIGVSLFFFFLPRPPARAENRSRLGLVAPLRKGALERRARQAKRDAPATGPDPTTAVVAPPPPPPPPAAVATVAVGRARARYTAGTLCLSLSVPRPLALSQALTRTSSSHDPKKQ